MNDSSCIFEIIYNTMQQSHNTMSIKTLCAMAGVSRSGYYAWLNAAPARAQREQQDREDFEQILTAYKMHGYSKGAKGIYMALLHMDPPVVMNLKKIRRLTDKFNLSCPYRGPNPYRRMAKALKTSSVADNLLQREFEAYGPRIVLLTDITYLPYNGTFAYLSTVLDAFTKQILSYVLSPSLEVDFVLETINKLVDIMECPCRLKPSSIRIRVVIIQATNLSISCMTKNCANPCHARETAGTTPHRKVSSAT